MPSGLLVPCSITRCLIVNVRWINNHIGPGSPRSAELRELVRDQAEKLSTPEMKGLQAVTDRRCQKNPGKDTSSLIKLSLKKKGIPGTKTTPCQLLTASLWDLGFLGDWRVPGRLYALEQNSWLKAFLTAVCDPSTLGAQDSLCQFISMSQNLTRGHSWSSGKWC